MTTTLATLYACGHRRLTLIHDDGSLLGRSEEIVDDGRAVERPDHLALPCLACAGRTRDLVLHLGPTGHPTVGVERSTYEPRIRVHTVPAEVSASDVLAAIRYVTIWPMGHVETQIGWGWLRDAAPGAILRAMPHDEPGVTYA